MIKDNKRIIFNGNGYSDEWQKEAAKRGLLNLRTSVDAYPELMKPDVVKAFEKYRVLNERELRARYDVALEQYNKTINIEAQLMVLMANRYILPAAYRYQTQVGAERRGGEGRGRRRPRRRASALDKLSALIDEFKVQVDALQVLLEHDGSGDAEKHAKYFRDKVVPAMARCARPATTSSASCRTTSGRCRPTGRCCSSGKNGSALSARRFVTGRRAEVAAPFFTPRTAQPTCDLAAGRP